MHRVTDGHDAVQWAEKLVIKTLNGGVAREKYVLYKIVSKGLYNLVRHAHV